MTDPVTIAYAVILLALTGFFAFLIRHQSEVDPEPEQPVGVELLRQHYAPGDTVEQPTPYYVAPIPAAPDPLEVAGNLDKKIIASAAMIFAIFAMVGAYFLIQPGIRDKAVAHQLALDVRRGKGLYASLCYDCHGRDGKGGVMQELVVDGNQIRIQETPFPGKPLNKTEFKYENLKQDPATLETTETLLRLTIERGRRNPPPLHSMPAWGRREGGPLSDWQVKQLVDLIMHGTEEDWQDIATVRRLEGAEVAEQIPPPPPPPSGRELFAQYCTSCHTTDLSRTSPLPGAPNLGDYGVKGPINAELKALQAGGERLWLQRWIANAISIKPGIAMPPFSTGAGGQLNDEAINLLVDYLRGLGATPGASPSPGRP